MEGRKGRREPQRSQGMTHNELSSMVLAAAIEVHKRLGPGMLEKTYKLCLAHELTLRGLSVATEVSLAIVYRGLEIRDAYRIDILVNDLVVVEVKAVDRLIEIHQAQTLTYLKVGDYRLGMLLNFSFPTLMKGYVRVVHELKED